jgi:hypothetical protein
VDEGRKETLAIVTAILIAPKLRDYHWDGGTRAPACESWLATAVSLLVQADPLRSSSKHRTVRTRLNLTNWVHNGSVCLKLAGFTGSVAS